VTGECTPDVLATFFSSIMDRDNSSSDLLLCSESFYLGGRRQWSKSCQRICKICGYQLLPRVDFDFDSSIIGSPYVRECLIWRCRFKGVDDNHSAFQLVDRIARCDRHKTY
jgi:hypothetical protein